MGKGRLDLPSNVNPCSGEERLPLVVVFPAYLSLLFSVGVSDALGLSSSSIAGGHTED